MNIAKKLFSMGRSSASIFQQATSRLAMNDSLLLRSSSTFGSPGSDVDQLHPVQVRLVHSSTTSKSTAKAGSKPDISSPVFNVQDEDDFKQRVLQSKVPVIVDFHATWCGPCKLLGPRLEALVSAKKGQITMAKVDIDDNSEIAEQFKVRSVPTVLAMKNGIVTDQFIGLVDDDRISMIIDKLIK